MHILPNLTRILLSAILVSFFLEVSAQNERDLVSFLEAGKQDATKLISAYINPMVEGVSYGVNGGWFTTAKAHKTLGFDIGVSLTAVSIPSSKNSFNVQGLGLQNAQLISPTTGRASTIIGPKTASRYQSSMDINGDGTNETIEFNGPEGLDFKKNLKVSGVLFPSAQIGIGIYKNTDIKIRWMPEMEAGSSKVKLIGFGVLHDIKQHIPGIKLVPFDLSLLAAFTKINGTTNLEGRLDKPSNDAREQRIDYEMNAWIVQALISKKVAIVTFYGGVGYNGIKTTSDVIGSYVMPYASNIVLKDPVSLSFKNSSFRLTGGIRFNFGPVYFTGNYTLQEYKMITAGLGVSVR